MIAISFHTCSTIVHVSRGMSCEDFLERYTDWPRPHLGVTVQNQSDVHGVKVEGAEALDRILQPGDTITITERDAPPVYP